MNKTVPFGIHHIAGHTIIKLNMNLTSEDAEAIRNKFGFNVTRIYSKPQLCRIEGALKCEPTSYNNLMFEFFQKVEEYKVNAKIEKLANKKAALLDRAIGADNLLINLNDLPF